MFKNKGAKLLCALPPSALPVSSALEVEWRHNELMGAGKQGRCELRSDRFPSGNLLDRPSSTSLCVASPPPPPW